MALVRGRDQTVTTRYRYGPFGELVEEQEGGIENPFRFSTKYYDKETGLCYYGYRYYRPDCGRWLSKDPIEEEGGFNLYGMVGNDVVNRWDYLGLVYDIIVERERTFPGHDILTGKKFIWKAFWKRLYFCIRRLGFGTTRAGKMVKQTSSS